MAHLVAAASCATVNARVRKEDQGVAAPSRPGPLARRRRAALLHWKFRPSGTEGKQQPTNCLYGLGVLILLQASTHWLQLED